VDTDETNLRCGICMPNPSIVALSFRDLSVHTDSGQEERRNAFIRTDGQTDLARFRTERQTDRRT